MPGEYAGWIAFGALYVLFVIPALGSVSRDAWDIWQHREYYSRWDWDHLHDWWPVRMVGAVLFAPFLALWLLWSEL